MRKKGPITAEELTAKLLANPEFRKKKSEQEQRRAERLIASKREQAPLLEALAAYGIAVQSVWDLVNTANTYDVAIPVLLEHLQLPYSDRTKEGIARALAVPSAISGWRVMVEQFRRVDWSVNPDTKDGLAVALARVSNDRVVDELIALAKDKTHGDSRLLLLSGLRRSKSPRARAALRDLAFDPALAKEIGSWKSNKRRGRSH